jgi:predicted RNase H-like nuclease (RuvC/YqgF family)
MIAVGKRGSLMRNIDNVLKHVKDSMKHLKKMIEIREDIIRKSKVLRKAQNMERQLEDAMAVAANEKIKKPLQSKLRKVRKTIEENRSSIATLEKKFRSHERMYLQAEKGHTGLFEPR